MLIVGCHQRSFANDGAKLSPTNKKHFYQKHWLRKLVNYRYNLRDIYTSANRNPSRNSISK